MRHLTASLRAVQVPTAHLGDRRQVVITGALRPHVDTDDLVRALLRVAVESNRSQQDVPDRCVAASVLPGDLPLTPALCSEFDGIGNLAGWNGRT